MIAAMSSAGVTSKAMLVAWAVRGETSVPKTDLTSSGSRSSIGMSAPLGVSRSIVDKGAAT